MKLAVALTGILAAAPAFGQTPKPAADPHADHVMMDRAQTAPYPS